MELRQILSTRTVQTEDWLKEYFAGLGTAERYPRRLVDAAAYSLFAGGKRLRPVLALLVNEACGSEAARVLPLAGALEMLHTYSLIHDDLPAMDNDDLRRGRPTCHRQFDEATAILAGDALLTEAFAALALLPDRETVPAVVAGFARATGFGGMVAGQMADIAAERGQEPADAGTLGFIHANKTGALLTASVVLPGIVNRLSPEKIAALESYGAHIGIAFQIADDVLNETSTRETLGKPTGTDRDHGKLTWTGLYGIERAREMAAGHIAEATAAIGFFGPAGRALELVARYIVDRKN